MANSIILEVSLDSYQSLVWRKQSVHTQYARLKNYLRRHLGDDVASLFAEPYIPEDALRGIKKAAWRSEVVSKKARPLTALSEQEQLAANAVLQTKLNQLLNYSQELLESENIEDNKWGQLINKALEIPDESHIIVEGDEVVLAAWGFQYKNKPQPLKLKKVEATPPIAIKEVQPQETEQTEKKTEQPLPTTQNNDEKEAKNAQKEEEPKAETDKEETKDEPKSKKKFNKKWLLLLLIPLLMAGGWWLWKSGIFTPSILPPESGIIVPIDSTDIVDSPDSVRRIVADRLNIALTGENKNIEEFAKLFKKEYPDKVYKILYYDTLTYRLQVRIPADRREELKTEIPERLKPFKMLIWYEGLFDTSSKPSDAGFSNERFYWYHERVKAFDAWQTTKGDSSLIVAIIDDGFDLSHPEFAGKIYKPWNVPEHSSLVGIGAGMFHGTHVASTAIAWANNSVGVSGIAPNCLFMPIQVANRNGMMTTTAVIDAVLYAINNGAHVVNMSLGMPVSESVMRKLPAEQEQIIARTYPQEEAFWNELFKIAHDNNVTFVLAGGNQNVLIGLDPMQRSSHTIKVSATAPDNTKAAFSNYGSRSTLSAPGVQIYNALPNNSYGFLDGTSMAAPIVTGGIALLKSVSPTLTTTDIIEILQTTGLPVNSADRQMGNIIQLDKAMGIAENNRGRAPRVDCPDLQDRIDDLWREIERIRRDCEERQNRNSDTLRIPPDEQDNFDFAVGKWKSTTQIHNFAGQRITLYFDFYADGRGEVTLVEPDQTECKGPLTLGLASGVFNINQTQDSRCITNDKTYNPYIFECKPDASGRAKCHAENKNDASNQFEFSLVKIK
ncbi:MAG: S8 family serine peptidase [Bernardetiaceae bacterium]|nr:S8 family serine peptidase [Bernardetiaceae bacterium]